jgi:hypothetical protein
VFANHGLDATWRTQSWKFHNRILCWSLDSVGAHNELMGVEALLIRKSDYHSRYRKELVRSSQDWICLPFILVSLNASTS